MSGERELIQTKRRRGIMLKFVRQGHEAQMPRMDDFEMWAMLQDMGYSMGRDQVLTMLQDLEVFGLLDFESGTNEFTGRTEIRRIGLTAAGVGVVTRRARHDDVLVD